MLIYSETIAVTDVNSVVTPVPARPTAVTLQNDGPNDVFIDFDRDAVPGSNTAVRLKAGAQVQICLDTPSFKTMSVIAASGETATVQATMHYQTSTIPQSADVDRVITFSANPGYVAP